MCVYLRQADVERREAADVSVWNEYKAALRMALSILRVIRARRKDG
jgi:hypothetical protein